MQLNLAAERQQFFYDSRYGTWALGGEDYIESWFLASKAGNRFFIKWRDLLCNLLHDRLDVRGVMQHPLYDGLDLSGINRLNQAFSFPYDFREYLAIHSMCHRLLETDQEARKQWRESWQRVDAAKTAFVLQSIAEKLHRREQMPLLQVMLSTLAHFEELLLKGVPLIKLTQHHYGQLTHLSKDELLSETFLVGRLLSGKVPADGAHPAALGVAMGAWRRLLHAALAEFGGGIQSCAQSLGVLRLAMFWTRIAACARGPIARCHRRLTYGQCAKCHGGEFPV